MDYVVLIKENGLAAVVLIILFVQVLPKLEKMHGSLCDLGHVVTLLIASLPEIKKRSRDEADRLKKRFEPDVK